MKNLITYPSHRNTPSRPGPQSRFNSLIDLPPMQALMAMLAARFEQMFTLLDEKRQQDAEVLGKAMRFGAMLWMNKDAERGEMRWFPKKKLLQLRLTEDMLPLFGEVAEARFNSLASSLEAQVEIKTVREGRHD